jgi:glutamate/tyrosine decarboxylase-like PLP-dependent enzyme
MGTEASSLMSLEQELRFCADLIARFEGALLSPRVTPVPPQFQPVWNDLRSALDTGGDIQRTLGLLLSLPGNACDPGAPSYVGYVPNAALPLARATDAYLSIVNAVAAGRIDGQSFVQAEFAVADKLGELAGFPADSRAGTFVQGGTLANFCALAAARERWRRRSRSGGSPVVVGARLSHASLKVAARLLDMPFIPVDVTDAGVVDVTALSDTVNRYGSRIAVIIGNAGTTTAGSIDPLDAVANLARRCKAWFHVDGAYGGAVLVSRRHRGLLAGISLADSFVVDPHKWLFCPYDSSLLLYRNAPEVQKELRVFSQSHESDAQYLHFGFRHMIEDQGPPHLPSDHEFLALQLSRRPRGVVLWTLISALGVDGLGKYIDSSIDATQYLYRYAAKRNVRVPVAPQLSVLLLSHEKWKNDHDWDVNWVRPAFDRGYFVSTDNWAGETVGRLCLVNPEVTGPELETLIDLVAEG